MSQGQAISQDAQASVVPHAGYGDCSATARRCRTMSASESGCPRAGDGGHGLARCGGETRAFLMCVRDGSRRRCITCSASQVTANECRYARGAVPAARLREGVHGDGPPVAATDAQALSEVETAEDGGWRTCCARSARWSSSKYGERFLQLRQSV